MISGRNSKAAYVCFGVGMAFILASMTGCGKKTEVGGPGPAGPKGDTGSQGSQGSTGSQGVVGAAGVNGYSALFGDVSSAPLSVCPNSGASSPGVYGQVFTMGVDHNDNGALEVSEISQMAVVCNGQNGQQGLPGIQGNQGAAGQTGATGATGATGSSGSTGQTGAQGAPGVSPLYSPVSVIEPCGKASSPFKEVLLGLTGGFILSEFSGSSDALTVRNSLVPDGSYRDTDASQCLFTISTDGSGNRAISWGSQTTANNYNAVSGSITYNASTQQWSGSN